MNILREAFGWNWRTWSKVLLESKTYKDLKERDGLKILEIGAGKYSAVSLLFSESKNEIEISYYLIDPNNLQKKIDYFKRIHSPKSCIRVVERNALNLPDKQYDLIIFKSVLGGIFRENSKEEINNYLKELKENHLTSSGSIITVDNGRSFIEKYISNIGSRKNDWFFFEKNTIERPAERLSFGTLSLFTLETRSPKMGYIFDNFIYILDLIISKSIQHNKNTVILNVLSNESKLS
jgi:hypothetical protein